MFLCRARHGSALRAAAARQNRGGQSGGGSLPGSAVRRHDMPPAPPLYKCGAHQACAGVYLFSRSRERMYHSPPRRPSRRREVGLMWARWQQPVCVPVFLPGSLACSSARRHNATCPRRACAAQSRHHAQVRRSPGVRVLAHIIFDRATFPSSRGGLAVPRGAWRGVC